MIFTPYDQANYLTSSFWFSSICFTTCKREIFEKEIEAIEDTTTIKMIPEETRFSNSYLKYAAIFVIGLGIAGRLAIQCIKTKSLTETILVKIQVQKQVLNKIQEATFFIESPIPAVTLSVKSR